MKAPFLLVIIVALHVVVVGSVLFIQGCGTARQGAPQPPPAPVMPPEDPGSQPVDVVRPGPVITPPAPEVDITRPKVEIKTYTVQPGDILSRIANKVGVSVRELSELNGIDDPDKIRVGQELVLPAYAKTQSLKQGTGSAPSAPAPNRAEPKVEPGDIYEVVGGDVLSRIAVRHGTTVAAIMQLNNLNSTKILVGQKLRMPAGAKPASSGTAAEEKDSSPKKQKRPESIFDTTEMDLDIREEQIADPAEEQETGQDLSDVLDEIEGDASAQPSGDSGTLFSINDAYKYTVAEGDTVKQIAMDFVVDPDKLRKMNNLAPADEVKPGQEILIPPAQL